ncbi:MAG: HEAT repeat domain-containing protein [Planctomycetaceae bacterium]|jgi:HEAT repeat protein|nr:HEAT repeat domain-containing protein [Planctomycetaceae bacterium]
MKTQQYLLIFPLLLTISVAINTINAQEMTSDESWNRLKTYQYGDDFKPLLIIEQEVMKSMASAETKKQCAARLAALLNNQTTYAGRQFVCLQLQSVAGTAEIPILAEFLNQSDDAENARMALGCIPDDAALAPLRQKLVQKNIHARTRIGIIGTLSERNDKQSIPDFVALINSEDSAIATAAASALGHFGTAGIEALQKAKNSISKVVVGSALIQAANDLVTQGKKDEALSLFLTLTHESIPQGIRRAACEGILSQLSNQERKTVIIQWFFENDPAKNLVAVARLKELSSEQFDELFEKSDTMSTPIKIAIFEIATEKQNAKLLDSLIRLSQSKDVTERLTAIRSLGRLRNAAAVPTLIAALQETALKDAATESLRQLPIEIVGTALMDTLKKPELRNSAIDVIATIKYYHAIDTMIQLASNEDENVTDSVITGLGRLCDPDDADLSRLIELYLKSRPGKHREKIERTIVIVCEKNPKPEERANRVLDLLAKRNTGLSNEILMIMLPLLGKIGNQRVATILLPLLDDNHSEMQQSAIRAFCNWPNADYHNDLWNIATKNTSAVYRQWALRAYVRVVTLKSNRPETETLEMLKKAMEQANTESDRQWTLSRTSAIRTINSVQWAASYLNDPILAQTACSVITELAHHRFLREPNKDIFVPILLNVEKIAKDKNVAERAKKARLGM